MQKLQQLIIKTFPKLSRYFPNFPKHSPVVFIYLSKKFCILGNLGKEFKISLYIFLHICCVVFFSKIIYRKIKTFPNFPKIIFFALKKTKKAGEYLKKCFPIHSPNSPKKRNFNYKKTLNNDYSVTTMHRDSNCSSLIVYICSTLNTSVFTFIKLRTVTKNTI